MLYELGQVSKHLKNGNAKSRKAARKAAAKLGMERPLRLFALLRALFAVLKFRC